MPAAGGWWQRFGASEHAGVRIVGFHVFGQCFLENRFFFREVVDRFETNWYILNSSVHALTDKTQSFLALFTLNASLFRWGKYFFLPPPIQISYIPL